MACRAVSLSNALVRELWLDASANKYTLPARAGCSYDTLKRRAMDLGLAPRREGGRLRICRATVRLMWLAGVSSREIGIKVGCSQSNVIRAAQAMALPPRGPQFSATMTLVEYQAVRLRLAMEGTVGAAANDPRQLGRVDSKGGRVKGFRLIRAQVAA